MTSSRRGWAAIAAVLAFLVAAGLYWMYDRQQRARAEEEARQRLARAVEFLDAGKVAEAERVAATIDPLLATPAELRSIRRAAAERRRGHFNYVLDRNGGTLAVYSFGSGDVIPLHPDSAPLIDRSGGAASIEARLPQLGTRATLRTTLDPKVQRAAAAALEGYRGSLVAIDVATDEILAIAVSGSPENLAFRNGYEPGSVVKVLTMLNAIDSGLRPEGRYPMRCEGFLTLAGKQFFDWASHGTLVDEGEAMAVSCNVAFALHGLDLGAERLRAHMRRSGFGAVADLGAFTVPLGRDVGDLLDEHAVASYAVGLEREVTSPLHVAMLAAALANGGTLTTPRLVLARHDVLGRPVWKQPAASRVTIGSPEAVARAVRAMREVVTDDRGTGRRAGVEGLEIAMKTGTSGDAAGGYDSVIMAFAPAGRPRIAIGMIAEDAGPAEFAGARIAQLFFSALAGTL